MVTSTPRIVFFLGKGGTGKTTLAALNALYLSQAGKTVHLLSLDPAHNIADVFSLSQPLKNKKVSDNLFLEETDLNYWVNLYLKQNESNILKTYRHWTAFNLERHLKVLRYAPGMEEYALQLAFENKIAGMKPSDYLVCDMPPTALTMRFFALPGLSLIWLKQLHALREEILDKREIITRIKFGKKEKQTDKVLKRLNTQMRNQQNLYDRFSDPEACRFNLVLNPDRLSGRESQNIINQLKEIGLAVNTIFLNRIVESNDIFQPEQAFSGYDIRRLKQQDYAIIGNEALSQCLSGNKHLFA